MSDTMNFKFILGNYTNSSDKYLIVMQVSGTYAMTYSGETFSANNFSPIFLVPPNGSLSGGTAFIALEVAFKEIQEVI